MLATFKALGRNDAGQALSEYGILLAVIAGFERLEALATNLFTDNPTVLVGAGVAALVLITATFSRSRI